MFYFLYINFALLSLREANFSMTLWLKSGMVLTRFFSIESMANALRRSCDIVFLRKVLILLRVEKHLSDSAVVIGVVMRIFSRATVFEKMS